MDKETNESIDDFLVMDTIHDVDDSFEDKNDDCLLTDDISEDKHQPGDNMVFWQPDDGDNNNVIDSDHTKTTSIKDIDTTNTAITTNDTATKNTDADLNNIEIHNEEHLEIEIAVVKEDDEDLHTDHVDNDTSLVSDNDIGVAADNEAGKDIVNGSINVQNERTSHGDNKPIQNVNASQVNTDCNKSQSCETIITSNSTNNNSTTITDHKNNHKRKHSISPILWAGNAANNADVVDGAINTAVVADSTDVPESKKIKTGLIKDRESRLKYIFRSARFFLIKSNNHDNVNLAKLKSVWSTPPQNEVRLNQAFKLCANVILVFSVTESGRFQGFARLASESDKNHPLVKWVLPAGLEHKAFNSVFKLHWISKMDLEFGGTMHLKNPWNMNRPVKIGRDGQEIEPTVGEVLCRMFPEDPSIALHHIASLAKHSLRKAHVQAASVAVAAGGSASTTLPPVASVPSGSHYGGGSDRGGRGGRGGHDNSSGGCVVRESTSSHMNNLTRDYRCTDYDRRRHEDRRYEGQHHHRSRMDKKADGIPVRYGVRREVLLNGSYSDYVREFSMTPNHPPNYPPSSNQPFPTYLQTPPPIYLYDPSQPYQTAPSSTTPYQFNSSDPYSYSSNPFQASGNHHVSAAYSEHRPVHHSSSSYRDNYDFKYSKSHHR